MGLVYNNIYIKTSTAKSNMADQSLMENYTIAGQKDISWTLGGSQGCYGTCVSERPKSAILDAVHSLSGKPVKYHYTSFKAFIHLHLTHANLSSWIYLDTTSKSVNRIADVQSCNPGNDHILFTLALSAGVHLLATRIIVIVV